MLPLSAAANRRPSRLLPLTLPVCPLSTPWPALTPSRASIPFVYTPFLSLLLGPLAPLLRCTSPRPFPRLVSSHFLSVCSCCYPLPFFSYPFSLPCLSSLAPPLLSPPSAVAHLAPMKLGYNFHTFCSAQTKLHLL